MKFIAFLFLCALGIDALAAPASQKLSRSKNPDELLKEADRLAWLKNWNRAEPLFRAAEVGFKASGDQRNALYAEVSGLRGELPRLALARVSQKVENYLNSPLVQSDLRLQLRCLAVKGDVDLDFDDRLAADDWERARDVATQLGEREWVARANGELGIVAFLHGDSSKALQLVFGALKSAQASHDVGAEIRYLTLLGHGMAEVGHYEQGLTMVDKAIALVETQPDLKDPMMQWSTKASVLERMGRVKDAESLTQRGMKVAGQDGYRGYAAELGVTLADIDERSGNIQLAIQILKTAKATAMADDYLRIAAEADLELSKCYERLNELKLARASSAEGVAISRKLGDKSQLPLLLGQLAKIESKSGSVARAEGTYQQAEDVIQGLLVTAVSVNTKASLLGTLSNVYLGHFNLEAYQKKNVARAYAVLEEIRGRSTSDSLSARAQARLTPEERRIEHQISGLQFQLMQTSSHARRKSLLDQLFTMEQSLAPAEISAKRHPLTTIDKKGSQLAILQKTLQSDEAVVEYVLDDPRSSALLITKNGARICPLAGKKMLDPSIEKFMEMIAKGQRPATGAADLSRNLLEPLRLPAAVRNITIVPDGELHQLPFEILPNGRDVLLKSMTVSYAPSGTVLAFLRNETNPISRLLLAVSGAPGQSGPPALLAQNATRGVYDLDFTKLPPLQAANDEVASVATASGLKATVLQGATATEDHLKSLRLADYDVIHFATHGVVSTKYPDRSALILNPESNRSDDGLLQAREIRRLHLSANLVTLAACSTGAGKLRGEEGIANLVQAFFISGARSIVANLWNVNDEFSRDFMGRFYTDLANGASVADALRQTKLSVIRDYGAGTNPSLWAGYVVYGDGTRKLK